MPPVRVLLVDDSLFMRNSLKKLLNVPELEIIDTASNGQEAVEKNLQLEPDVILLDIEMPVMNGIAALKQIMATRPTAVIMFSTLTQDGAAETIEALSHGAVDFIPKSSSYFDVSSVKDEIVSKLVSFGRNTSFRSGFKKTFKPSGNAQIPTAKGESLAKNLTQVLGEKIKPVPPKYQTNRRRPEPEDIKVITIGISTGGPVALQELIPHLPANLPVSILIVQHMPPLFTETLAKRLDQASKISVKEAADGDILKPGVAYIAKGSKQMVISRRKTIQLTDEPAGELFKPSVNVMINSVVDVYRGNAVGIIMTGMGNDGCVGLKNLESAGGYIIAQSPDSCVVAGMPKAVIDAKIAHEIHPLRDLANVVSSLFNLSPV